MIIATNVKRIEYFLKIKVPANPFFLAQLRLIHVSNILWQLKCDTRSLEILNVAVGWVGGDILDGFVLGLISKRPLSAISPPIVDEDAPLSHDSGRLAHLQSR